MSSSGRSTEEMISEFEGIIEKMQTREEELKTRLYQGGRDLEFEIPVAVAGFRKLRIAFEAALWVLRNPGGGWHHDAFIARDILGEFGETLKLLIDPIIDNQPLDRGIDYLLGTYFRAFHDAFDVISDYTDRYVEDLKRRVDIEFPPDPSKKGTTYFRERKAEKTDD